MFQWVLTSSLVEELGTMQYYCTKVTVKLKLSHNKTPEKQECSPGGTIFNLFPQVFTTQEHKLKTVVCYGISSSVTENKAQLKRTNKQNLYKKTIKCSCKNYGLERRHKWKTQFLSDVYESQSVLAESFARQFYVAHRVLVKEIL